MARKLESHSFQRGSHAKADKNRWPMEWFNGEVWECIKGEDFTHTVSSFRSSVGDQAKANNLKIRGNVYPAEGRVVFQAYTPDPEPQDSETPELDLQ